MKLINIGLCSALMASVVALPAYADIKIGMLAGITGGAAALAPDIIHGFNLAAKDVNAQGGLLKSEKLVGVLADDGCNPQIAADAATKVVNVSHVVAIVGPFCSGATIAAANSASIPAGIALISPAATSPLVSQLKDNDTVFRTTASDEYLGVSLANSLIDRGTNNVAVAFLNNDYGKAMAQTFKIEYEKLGGKISGFAAHEENKSSYRTDLAELARAGADTLVMFDYGNSSGLTVLREGLENGFFKNYIGGDGFKSSAPIKALGAENLKNFLVIAAISAEGTASDIFSKAMKEDGGNPDAAFAASGYDSVFIMALAIEKAGGDKAKIPAAIREVTKVGGEPIFPREWKKAKELIAAGKAISYQGANGSVAFDKNGDVPGIYALFKVEGDELQKLAIAK